MKEILYNHIFSVKNMMTEFILLEHGHEWNSL